MSKLKEIPRGSSSSIQRSGGPRKYLVTQMLLDAGYTEKQIRKMKKDGRLLVSFNKFKREINGETTLYVLENEEENKEESTFIDRGYLIDLE